MKIKNMNFDISTEEPKQEIADTLEFQGLSLSDSGGDNESEADEEDTPPESQNPYVNVEIHETLTPSGSNAIRFISPISNQEVICLVPSNRRLSAIAQETVKQKAQEDPIMQMAIFLKHLICKYADKEGEKCLGLNWILDRQDPKETRVLCIIINNFFRLGEI